MKYQPLGERWTRAHSLTGEEQRLLLSIGWMLVNSFETQPTYGTITAQAQAVGTSRMSLYALGHQAIRVLVTLIRLRHPGRPKEAELDMRKELGL